MLASGYTEVTVRLQSAFLHSTPLTFFRNLVSDFTDRCSAFAA
jgi:hypothetical protein